MLRSILSDKTSRNLFFFLCLNLSFAFVELLYGIWSNRYRPGGRAVPPVPRLPPAPRSCRSGALAGGPGRLPGAGPAALAGAAPWCLGLCLFCAAPRGGRSPLRFLWLWRKEQDSLSRKWGLGRGCGSRGKMLELRTFRLRPICCPDLGLGAFAPLPCFPMGLSPWQV